eukprot:3341193-Lingulodinium_polyedra.AAC.1
MSTTRRSANSIRRRCMPAPLPREDPVPELARRRTTTCCPGEACGAAGQANAPRAKSPGGKPPNIPGVPTGDNSVAPFPSDRFRAQLTQALRH